MSTRKLLALAAIAPLVLGVAAADAAAKKPAPKPVCKLLTDGAADATGTGTTVAGPNDPNLDLVSVDVATNATTLTAVIRLTAFGSNGDTSPYGRAYDVAYVVNGKSTTLRSVIGPAATTWANGLGTGSVVGNEIHVHVPLAKLPVPLKPGTKLTDLGATSYRWVAGTDAVVSVSDRANGGKPYVAGYPSCVKVGS